MTENTFQNVQLSVKVNSRLQQTERFWLTKFQKHSDKRKAKEKKKKRGEGKDEFKEKKATVAPLVFNNGYFIMASCEKNCWMQKILLAVTYQKIRLDIHIHENFNKAHPLSYHFPFITT